MYCLFINQHDQYLLVSRRNPEYIEYINSHQSVYEGTKKKCIQWLEDQGLEEMLIEI